MHSLQEKLLNLIDSRQIGSLSLREIGSLIGERFPQKVKHHLAQLEQKGLIKIDRSNKNINRIKSGKIKDSNLLSIPILGAANCGQAVQYADQHCSGYLRVSPALLSKQKDIFVLQADGPSMNKAEVNGKQIEDGDYLIIDGDYKTAKNGDIVVSIIDGMANIKRFFKDQENNQVVLMSESTKDFAPIYIHEDDDFLINGKVIQVIKKPKM